MSTNTPTPTPDPAPRPTLPSLADRVFVVTGASQGIGRAVAEALAEQRATVVAVARSADTLAQLAASLPAGRVQAVPADLTDPAAPAAVVEQALARCGRLDGLVNAAGDTRRGDFLALTEADWAAGFGLKFFAAVRLTRAAWPHLVASQGAIVNVVGIGGRTASQQFTVGGAVNAALLNFTKAMADRGVADGVRVNAVNPGTTRTGRLQARLVARAGADGGGVAEAARAVLAAQGIARFAEPAEIAAAVAWLLSAQASYCQGALLDVDGGATRTL